MEITFKYQGKIISTPNLEKKLKRMKISIDDIEIIDPIKKEIKEIEENDNNKQMIIIRSNEDDIRRICYVDKNKNLPTIMELFKHHIWNPETKTGIKELTKEKLETFYYAKLGN